MWCWWWQPPCLRRSVIVNRKDDPDVSIRGVFWSARGPWYLLRDAEALVAGAEKPQRIRGEVLIHRDNVAFIQLRQVS
jgi:hypothetical protein